MIERTVNYNQVQYMIDSEISKINTMFVGIVSGVDYSRNRYDVQPIIKTKAINDEYIDKALIIKCPMSFTKTKSFYIRAPYEVGDIVYIGCNKESVDVALTGSVTLANTEEYRYLFREMDGVILGGVMNDIEPELSSDNLSDFIIQNRDNNDVIILQKTGGAKIKTSSQITLDTPVTNITGDVNIEGATHIKGATAIDSSLNVQSSITGATVTNGSGIDIGTHVHEYISPSGPKKTGVGE